MKKVIKTIKIKLKKMLIQSRNDDMMMYFRTEYKKNPAEAFDYWMNTGSKNYY